jgi:hypothetical protein
VKAHVLTVFVFSEIGESRREQEIYDVLLIDRSRRHFRKAA